MGAVLKRVLKRDPAITPPASQVGVGDWDDLSGLLLPVSEEEGIVRHVKEGTIENIEQLLDRFEEINGNGFSRHLNSFFPYVVKPGG